MKKRTMKLVVGTVLSAAAISVLPLTAHAGSESGTTPTCVAGAKPTVRGEQTSLNVMRVEMPSGTIRYNAATTYVYTYKHPSLKRASWYVTSPSLLDSGTYGMCLPG